MFKSYYSNQNIFDIVKDYEENGVEYVCGNGGVFRITDNETFWETDVCESKAMNNAYFISMGFLTIM